MYILYKKRPYLKKFNRTNIHDPKFFRFKTKACLYLNMSGAIVFFFHVSLFFIFTSKSPQNDIYWSAEISPKWHILKCWNISKMTFQAFSVSYYWFPKISPKQQIVGKNISAKIFPKWHLERHFRSLLIPKNLPKMTFRRHLGRFWFSKISPKRQILEYVPQFSRQNFHGWTNMKPESHHNDIFFMYCELKLLNPANETFDFNVKKESWSFLIPENLSKMTFFELNFENLPKSTYFLIRSKSPQNDNYFFCRFFQKKKNNSLGLKVQTII